MAQAVWRHVPRGGDIPLPTGAIFIADFNQPSTLWQDLAATIPVDTINDPIWVTDNSDGADTFRAGASASRPLWLPESINGKGVARFDGINDNMAADANMQAAWNGAVAGADKKFSVHTVVDGVGAADTKHLTSSIYTPAGQRQFTFLALGGKLRVIAYYALDNTAWRGWITDDVVFDGSKCLVSMSYDGTLDTNNGLDRVKLFCDNVECPLSLIVGPGLIGSIPSTTARLSLCSTSNTTGGVDLAYEVDMAISAAYPGIDKRAEVDAALMNNYAIGV